MVHDITYDPNYSNFQFFFVCPFVGCSTKEGVRNSKQITTDTYEKKRPCILLECIDSMPFIFLHVLTCQAFL